MSPGSGGSDSSIYMPGLSGENIRTFREKLRTPEGTFMFVYSGEGLFDFSPPRVVLLQVIAGSTLFVLERESSKLSFIHASPGEGTRIATVNLADLKPVDRLKLAFTWSHEGTTLYVGPADEPSTPLRGEGARSTGRQLLVTTDGRVIQIGDDGLEVFGVRMFVAGKQVLQSPAASAWEEVTKASKLLLEHLKQDINDQMLRVLLANQVLSMLVTGYETYCERRFLEMIREGRQADFEKLASKFLSKTEREGDAIELIKQEATALLCSPVEVLVQQGRIDFQNYQKSKKAYSAAYGIRFGEMRISSQVLENLQEFIKYRHRIIHISPLLGMLNQPDVPTKEPVFASYEVAHSALEDFDAFFKALHQQTLTVLSPDQGSK